MHENKLSATERLSRRMYQYPSESRLLLLRNLSFGSAAACLVVISQIIQVGAKDSALAASVTAGCVAMPLWIAVGAVFEYFLNLGKRSYPFLQKQSFRVCIALLMLVAGLGLLLEAGAAIWYLSVTAAWIFAGSVVVAVLSVALFQAVLANWWYGPNGPDAKDRAN